jgi:hypothetical protein
LKWYICFGTGYGWTTNSHCLPADMGSADMNEFGYSESLNFVHEFMPTDRSTILEPQMELRPVARWPESTPIAAKRRRRRCAARPTPTAPPTPSPNRPVHGRDCWLFPLLVHLPSAAPSLRFVARGNCHERIRGLAIGTHWKLKYFGGGAMVGPTPSVSHFPLAQGALVERAYRSCSIIFY